MLKLFLIIYIVASPTLAGILMTVALAARMSNNAMYWLIAAGFAIAIPVSWYIARAIDKGVAKKNA